MSTTDSDYARIEQLLASAASDTTAAAADGRLLSLAAMLGDEAAPVWLNQLASETGAADHAAVAPLGELAASRVRALADTDSLPVPWLPDDEDDLRDRVEAIVEWAGGFLAGLGEGAALRGSPARKRLDEEPLAELISDLGEISRAALSEEDIEEDINAAEAAYTEIVEYLRVLAQLAYEELAPIRALASGPDTNVH
ncbi:MAG: UPF0149 family protein [Pseudomonadota bacterium]